MDRSIDNAALKSAVFGFLSLCVAVTVAAISWDLNPGWLSYLAVLPAAIVVGITALVRANDITPEKADWHWQVRKLGFAMAGIGACLVILAPFFVPDKSTAFPSWRGVIVTWGVALTWLTTPNQPPWWQYITKGAHHDEP